MRKLIAIVGLSLLAGTLFAAQRWQTLDDCRLVHNEANDGDSFHVQHNGHEYIFRLYFVDAPETEDDFPDRVEDQAAYFSVSHRRTLELGRVAAQFTAHALAEHFTVVTRWDDARGRSRLPRNYAFIITSEKKDLGQLLVQNGLARIYGEKAVAPDGLTVRSTEQKLLALERQARNAHIGGWSSNNYSISANAAMGTDQTRRLSIADGMRHNSRCPLFNAPGTRGCSPDEGRPCPICGG